MATQLQALLVAAVLAVAPMVMTQAIDLTVAPVVAQTDAPAWAITYGADFSQCGYNCAQNWNGVGIIYCGLWSIGAGPIAGFACAVGFWA